MVDQLKDYKYAHRIEAVDGRNTEYFNNNYDVNYIKSKNFTTALIAVICSHAKAIKTAENLNHEIACVLED